ncbi:MAG TPA: hypothetical protein VGG06_32635 [Thermoanaerobaculia bacterium]
MSTALLTTLRSLGFGGLLGAGLFGTIYAFFLSDTVQAVSLTEFTVIGGLLGAGFSQALERYVSSLMSAMSHKVSYYMMVAELHFQVRLGLLSQSRAAQILDHLTEQYFLGDARDQPSLTKGKGSLKSLPGGD